MSLSRRQFIKIGAAGAGSTYRPRSTPASTPAGRLGWAWFWFITVR